MYFSALPTSRIVDGTDAVITDYPSLVSLQIYGTHACGATIINKNWILSAAHCFTA